MDRQCEMPTSHQKAKAKQSVANSKSQDLFHKAGLQQEASERSHTLHGGTGSVIVGGQTACDVAWLNSRCVDFCKDYVQ